MTRRQEEEGDIILGENIDFNIHRALVKEEQEGGSSKIRFACKEARRLAKEGKKQSFGVILNGTLSIWEITYSKILMQNLYMAA